MMSGPERASSSLEADGEFVESNVGRNVPNNDVKKMAAPLAIFGEIRLLRPFSSCPSLGFATSILFSILAEAEAEAAMAFFTVVKRSVVVVDLEVDS